MTKPVVLFALAGSIALGGCQDMLRPQLTPVAQGQGLAENTQTLVQPPVSIPQPAQPAYGSLWVPGSKQFFKDSRAHKVGDIVTVTVDESSSAASTAGTSNSRSHTQQSGILGLLNMGGKLVERGIPLTSDGLVNTDSDRSFDGSGKTNRTDTLSASIAAVVTQVLPNGLLVIQGQREVLVNYEKQVMVLQGIIRPEDITAQNTISSDKIAQARIAYSGRGVVDEAQTPQYGVRLLDKVLPF